MSNPTTLVEPFNGALGAFSGVAPIRYNGGLWLEEGATNLATTPLAPTVLAYGHITSATVTGLSIDHPLGGHSDRVKRVTIASGAGSADQFGANVSLPSPPASGTSFRCSVLMQFSAGRIGDTVQLQLGQRTGAGTIVTTTLKSYVVSGAMQLLSDDIVMSTADRTTIYVYVRSNAAGDQDIGSTFDVTFLDVRQSPYSTSACPSVDSSGTILSGWIWSGTAHASTSTRAASSASVTTAEPVSVACWYREGYGGAKSFAYLDTLGQLGDYGDISYAAGDLTISTSRNLVIGPFAAFDRGLTANEQANLRSTQNWSMNSVNGSNIILPLSGRRRPR